ncbi:MAG: hypothetical protein U1C46_07455 [Bacteroidales bacterium]|nr:hypothetical protein [Bacteroidales bacterium]
MKNYQSIEIALEYIQKQSGNRKIQSYFVLYGALQEREVIVIFCMYRKAFKGIVEVFTTVCPYVSELHVVYR